MVYGLNLKNDCELDECDGWVMGLWKEENLY